jgi:hypothetical protein
MPSGIANQPDPGLCRDCRYSHRIESDRGSIFFRCELSLQNPQFPKYPRLPVRECSGYQPANATKPQAE